MWFLETSETPIKLPLDTDVLRHGLMYSHTIILPAFESSQKLYKYLSRQHYYNCMVTFDLSLV